MKTYKRVIRVALATGVVMLMLLALAGVFLPAGLNRIASAQDDADGDGVADVDDACPAAPGDPTAEGCPLYAIDPDNAAALTPLRDLPYDGAESYTRLTDMAYSGDASVLFALYDDVDVIHAWAPKSGLVRALPLARGGDLARLTSFDLVLDGLIVVGAHNDSDSRGNWAAAWDIVDNELIATFYNNTHMADMAVSPDGERMANCGQYSFEVWRLETGEQRRSAWSVESDFDDIEGFRGLAWHPNSALIAVYSDYSRRIEASIHIYDVTQRTEVTTLTTDTDLSAIAFSPSGDLLAAGDIDGHLYVWDTATWTLAGDAVVSDFYVHAIAFNPSSDLIAALGGGDSAPLMLLDAATLTPLLTVPDVDGRALAFRPDGMVLASGYQGDDLRLWGVTDPERTAPAQSDQPPAEAAIDITGTVATGVNLRGGPGTSFDVVGSLAAGDSFALLARNDAGDWLYIRAADGTEAWVFADLVTADGDPSALPVR